MNKVMLIGNLGKDPVMNYTQNGTAITRFSIAVNRRTRTPNGDWQDETEWINIVAWDKLAERCSQFLHKGNKVFVEGRLTQRKFVGSKDNVERLMVEVVINDMEMLTPKSQQPSSEGSGDFLSGEDDVLGDLDDHPF